MKKRTVIMILISTFLLQCTDYKNGEVSGYFKNIAVNSISLIDHYGDTLFVQTPDDNNKFNFKLDSYKEDYYRFKYDVAEKNSGELSLYLKPDEDISIIIDSLHVVFSGKGSKRNEYLNDKHNYNWYSKWYPHSGKIGQEAFYRDSVTKVNRERVKTLVDDPEFLKRELKYIAYDYAYFILASLTSDLEILNDKKWAKSFDNNNTKELKRSKEYIRLVARQMAYKDSLSMDMITNVHNSIEHKYLQKIFISEFKYPFLLQLRRGNDNYQKAIVVKDFLDINYPNLKEKFTSVFNGYQKFYDAEKQKTSFSYEDAKGNTVNLSDFEGKYVYIDFWATWCGWCIKEFPKLDEMKERFKDKNIEFITISIDFEKDKRKWKDYVIKNKLGGFQLIAPLKEGKTDKHTSYVSKEEIDDPFLTLLYVNSFSVGIPQYSLIDPNGKVIDASAPRPSNENFINYIYKYLE